MEDWRKKGDKCNQEFASTKSNNHYRKPAIGGSSNWQPSVPSWEKQFVASVGSLSWKKFSEAKKFTHLYSNILKWDDSAGQEAFQTSKDQFHAKLHGLPCHVKPQNPNLYIDEVDWNAKVDRNLILDLDSDYVALDADSEREPVVIFGDVLPDPYKDYSPYGWGDCDDKKREVNNDDGINWDDYINNFDDEKVRGDYKWWWDWVEADKKAEEYQDRSNDKNVYHGWNTYEDNNYYGNVYNERREGSGRYMTSQKTSRFHRDNNHRNRSWRNNGNWRKSNGQAHGSQRIHVQP